MKGRIFLLVLLLPFSFSFGLERKILSGFDGEIKRIILEAGPVERKNEVVRVEVDFGKGVDLASLKLLKGDESVDFYFLPIGEYRGELYFVVDDLPRFSQEEYLLCYSEGNWGRRSVGDEKIYRRFKALNIIPNAGFEIIKDGKLANWDLRDCYSIYKDLPDLKSFCRVTNEDRFEGKRSLKLASEIRDDKAITGIGISKIFPLKPKTQYRFSYKYKITRFNEKKLVSSLLPSLSVEIQLFNEKKERIYPKDYNRNRIHLPVRLKQMKPEEYLNEWLENAVIKETPKEVRYGRVWIYFWAAEGECLVDDLFLTELGREPIKVRIEDSGNIIGVFEEAIISPNAEKVFEINVPVVEKGKDIILEFKARIDSEEYRRGDNVMKVFLNDKDIDLKYLVNRPENTIVMPGWSYETYVRFWSGYFLFKAPNFGEFPSDNPFRPAYVDPYLFEFRITDFLKEGRNVLKIVHTGSGIKENLIVKDGRIRVEDRIEKKVKEEDLKYIEPKNIEKVPIKLEMAKGGAIRVGLNSFDGIIASRYSLEGGGWAELNEKESSNFDKVRIYRAENGYKLIGETKDFVIEKEVALKNLCVEVREKFKNKTDKILPLKHRHQIYIPNIEKLYLGGQIIPSRSGTRPLPTNPTTICIVKEGAIGLIALDDVFRVHFRNFGKDNYYGIGDEQLVIRPNSEITIKWAVFLSEEPDYYSVINLMRKYLGVNFRIEGPMAFIHPRRAGTKWRTHPKVLPGVGTSVEDLRKYLRNKSVKFAVSFLGEAGKWAWQAYDGEVPMGTAFQEVVEVDRYRKFFKNLKEAWPQVKTGVYFHCFLDVLRDGPEKYKDSRTLDEKGNHVEYGYGRKRLIPLRVYFPTLNNTFGKAISKNIDIILDEIGADGVYWDEFEYSYARYHYGEPHDGVSADIDWKDNRIIRLKSSVTLISQPWRMRMVEYIAKRGKFMIFNMHPNTETSLEISKKYRIPRFIENGGSSTPCVATHLYTPIALGNHLFEQTVEDCHWWILRVLNHGCVYYWYHDGIWADYPTMVSYMYPITPVEIGKGYVIGKERILTAKSGYFSFGDLSEGEVHFFGKDGKEIKKNYTSVIKDGKRYYKIVLGENEGCVIVRKKTSSSL